MCDPNVDDQADIEGRCVATDSNMQQQIATRSSKMQGSVHNAVL